MKLVNGWIVLDVCDYAVTWAQALFTERQKAGVPNCFNPGPGVLPWIGDLAEIYFDRWLREEKLPGYVWHRGQPFRKRDFTMPTGRTVDVKCCKRNVPVLPHYDAEVNAAKIDNPVDDYFFACYVEPAKRIWLLGGVAKRDFLAAARYCPAGTVINQKRVIEPGQEMYTAKLSHVAKPADWLRPFVPVPESVS